MFELGALLMILGAFCVYGTNYIVSKILRFNEQHVLRIKAIGLAMALIGTITLLKSEFPSYLKFLRIF